MYRHNLIVEAMKEQEKTNESLAHECGLTHATISRARQGKTLELPTLQLIAGALGLTMGELCDAELDEPKAKRSGNQSLGR